MIGKNRTFRHWMQASVLSLGLLTGLTVAGSLVPGAFTFHDRAFAGQHGVASRDITLAAGKSAVVRLPAGVKDLLIGNDEVAEIVLRSKRTMYIFARKVGATNIFLLGADGRPVGSINLNIVLDPSGLRKLLKRALPNADIKVDIVGEQILLSGTAKTPAEANKAVQIAENYGSKQNFFRSTKGKVVNSIRLTGKDQVTIKVKLAEVQRSVMKQLRTNLPQLSFETGNLSGIIGLLFPFSAGSGLSTGTSSALLNYSGSKVKASALLEAMERDGLMRLLAEPTLTAISGEAARFMVGGEVPIITGYDKDTKTYLYEQRPFGMLLGFSPVVLSESRISLKVNVEVSEISSKYSIDIGGSAIPGMSKRKVATTVELPSGGTLALAGMLREDTAQNIDGVPGLKNLPILGALFRSRDFRSNQTELVVLATPYIVKPRNEKKFRTPIDGLNNASDYQTYFLGRLHRVYGAPTGPKGGRKVYHGDVGFILE